MHFDEAALARLQAHPRRFVLFVSHALGGGVERRMAGRMRDVRSQGLEPLLLRPDPSPGGGLWLWCDIESGRGPVLQPHFAEAHIDALFDALGRLDIEHVELHHFLGFAPPAIARLRALSAPQDVHLHDYVWLCPRVTLIGPSGRHCGEPALRDCESCRRSQGSHLEPGLTVAALRERSLDWLAAARRIYAPSQDTARRYARILPGLDITYLPYAGAPAPQPVHFAPAHKGRRLRVALVGAIAQHKGYEVLLECARDAARRDLALEFLVVGFTQDDDSLKRTGRVRITGAYPEGEALASLRKFRADIGWMASVWPETWCYSLDILLESGLPLLGFDLGAQAERMRAAGRGASLLPVSAKARDINDALLKMPRDGSAAIGRASGGMPVALGAPAPAIASHSAPAPTRDPVAAPGAGAASGAASFALESSSQLLPLPPGHYLFSVRTATPVRERGTGGLYLPAVHVSPGPGVAKDQVEFLSGPSSHGDWLFALGDVLVAKVGPTGATLVVHSMRASGGSALGIKVEVLAGDSPLLQGSGQGVPR